MSEPLILDGVRYCRNCVAKLDLELVEVPNHPGIFNNWTGVRHLNKDKRYLRTLCGLETKNENWQTPWREFARQEARWHAAYRRNRPPRSGVGSP